MIESKNILNGCSAYLIGSIENENGQPWREHITKELKPLGINCFNPFIKPFVDSIDETKETQQELFKLRENGEFDKLSTTMSRIREFDLNLVERSDFNIAKISPKIASHGSCEELQRSAYLNKPTFIAIDGGVRCCPLWYFGIFKHKYFYNSIEEIIEMLKSINSGETEIDSNYWKLLKMEHRL